jgi:spectinomycin phosphotransferase
MAGRAWATLGDDVVALYPYIEGKNAFQRPLSPPQWTELGTVMRELHELRLPADLLEGVPTEDYSDTYRQQVHGYLARVSSSRFEEPVAGQLAGLLGSKRTAIEHMLRRAGELGAQLLVAPPPVVPCHADLHAGNVLVDGEGEFFVVDWDTVMLAPRERDLMFIGGGIGGAWNRQEEREWFMKGYGEATVNGIAQAYYRYERILEDIAGFCEQLLDTREGGADRARGVHKLAEAFEPGDVVEIAMREARP